MIALLLATVASAAPMTAPYAEPGLHTVHVDAGMDPALLAGVGIAATLPGEHPVSLEAVVRTVPSLSSGDLAGSVGLRLRDEPGIDLMSSARLELKALANPVHSGLSSNVRLTVLPGWYGERWFLAAEGSAQATVVSALWHSDAYEALFPEVHDGLLGPGAVYLYGGLRAGGRLGRFVADLSVTMRTGADLKNRQPYLQPYTGTLRLGYAW